MPHVISLQCANPDCTAHLDSEEIHVWEGEISYGAEIVDFVEIAATDAGWTYSRGQWSCPRCHEKNGEWVRDHCPADYTRNIS